MRRVFLACVIIMRCAGIPETLGAPGSPGMPGTAGSPGIPMAAPPGPELVEVFDPIRTAPSIAPSPTLSNTTSACVPYQCNLFYQYVSVYYWPQASANTDCLSTISDSPTPTYPPGLTTVQSPSVVVVFPSVIASDGCNQIGSTYADITTSFDPNQLSTILADGSSQSFNFADLPCPPPGVQWNQGPVYAPLLAPPPFLFGLDPAFSTCIPGASQGVDPPTALPTAGGVSGPGQLGDGHPQKRHMRAEAHKRAQVWAPVQTAPPR